MTDHITIPRAMLEQAHEALDVSRRFVYQDSRPQVDAAFEALRAELARSADIADEMSAVADQFAHRLALDLECVLADYSGTWYDTAICTLGAYRGAMNAIHERESPTFMGEPVIRPALAAPATAPEQPAWHDAPTCDGLWMCNDGDDNPYRRTTHRITFPLNQLLVGENERWYGPIPQDGEKS